MPVRPVLRRGHPPPPPRPLEVRPAPGARPLGHRLLAGIATARQLAYALNGHKADQFRHQADPFAVEVATSRVERDGLGYSLDGRRDALGRQASPILAELRFRPGRLDRALRARPRHARRPAQLDPRGGRLPGRGAVDDRREIGLTFAGRGYHDHNAGAEEMSLAMKRWEWGRSTTGPVRRQSITRATNPSGRPPRELWITCRDGRPEAIRRSGDAIRDLLLAKDSTKP